MEKVPFAFCQSGVHRFTRSPSEPKLLSIRAWQRAIDALHTERIDVEYSIGYNDGVWSYRIRRCTRGHCERITFEELQKVNRRNLRICRIWITPETHEQQAPFEEVLNLVKFALPFVNKASLIVDNTVNFPQNDLQKMLSYLLKCSIACRSPIIIVMKRGLH